jgi:hypothetical protein
MRIVVEVGDWESHHDLSTLHSPVDIRGRLEDVSIEHPDGSTEPIERLPSGRALRGPMIMTTATWVER